MNFTFTSREKIVCIALMIIGVISIATSFMTHNHQAWANLLMSNFYFLAIALGATFFVAVNYAANSGWMIAVKRVPEAMGSYLPFAGIIMFIILIFGGHHLYHWMHEGLTNPMLADGTANPDYDSILEGKSAFLNKPFFFARILFYFVVWIGFYYLVRKLSLLEDKEGGFVHYNKAKKYSVAFLVLFAITSSMAAWDILMSLDAHWFSSLFGWFTFSIMFITGLFTMAFLIWYLKKRSLAPHISDEHIHDVGKFVFAFSIFFTYLWFSQYMLIWYANIPEEVTYYLTRFTHYRWLFWLAWFINFIPPFLILMANTSKRSLNTIMVVCIILFVGHWINLFVIIMPGVVKADWHISWMEIGTTLGFLGLFLFTTFTSLTKASLKAENHPLMGESMHHHVI